MRRASLRRMTAGLTVWEVTLFFVFLAVAGGASIFFFVLGSRDMEMAKGRFVWSRDVHALLDRMAQEIAFASEVEHPFAGEAHECRFRQVYGGGSELRSSLLVEGFSFLDDTLIRTVRDASGTNRLPQGEMWKNPLLKGVKAGFFRRVNSNKLLLQIQVVPPGSDGKAQTFERVICLRN